MKKQITNEQYVLYVAIGAALLLLLTSPVPGLSIIGAIGVFAMIYYINSSILNLKNPLIPIVIILLSLGIGLIINQQSTKLEPLRNDWFLIICLVVIYISYFFGAIAGYFKLRKKGIIKSGHN